MPPTPLNHTNVTYNGTAADDDQRVFIVQDAILLIVSLILYLLFYTLFKPPPTHKQAEGGFQGFKNNFVYLCSTWKFFLTSILIMIRVGLEYVDIELLRDMLHDSGTGLDYGEAAASNVIIIWHCGLLVGLVSISPLLKHIPINIVQFTSVMYAMSSLVRIAMLVALIYHSYVSICCLYFFYGVFNFIAYNCALAIAFEQTYPLDSMFVSSILNFVNPITFSLVLLIARQLFILAGYIGPSLMEIMFFVTGFIIASTYKPKLRRSLQLQLTNVEKTHLLSKS